MATRKAAPTADITCSCTVTVSEIAGQLGATTDHARFRIGEYGFALVEDWAGRQALPVDHAAVVVSGRVAAAQEHRSRWRAYQQYLKDRRTAARKAREKAIREAREQSRRKHRRRSQEFQKAQEQKAAQDAEQRARREWERDGKPADFARFAKSQG